MRFFTWLKQNQQKYEYFSIEKPYPYFNQNNAKIMFMYV